jgi:hypothetical protein
MTISGSPKVLACDVAKGLAAFTGATLRAYSPDDLNVIMNALTMVQREIRADLVPPDDALQIRDKKQKLQRLTQAASMTSVHMHKHSLRRRSLVFLIKSVFLKRLITIQPLGRAGDS